MIPGRFSTWAWILSRGTQDSIAETGACAVDEMIPNNRPGKKDRDKFAPGRSTRLFSRPSTMADDISWFMAVRLVQAQAKLYIGKNATSKQNGRLKFLMPGRRS